MNLASAEPRHGAQPKGAHGVRAAEFMHQFLTFKLDNHTYAVPLTQVAEITVNLELNHMPHMPKGVEGLLNLRGKVLPVINLRTRLGVALRDSKLSENILILDTGGHDIGILVDRVESVLTITSDQLTPAVPLLSGPEGSLVSGFIVLQQRIVAVLDTRLITAVGSARVVASSVHEDLGEKLDESLRKLIDLAPRKTEVDATRIIPQMEAAIAHTEDEMAKVVDRIEGMLASADRAFNGLARLKQEANLGRFRGQETGIAEIERIGTQIQDQIFALLQQIQFQDIARQKLERVLNHIRGLQAIVGVKFRDLGQS